MTQDNTMIEHSHTTEQTETRLTLEEFFQMYFTARGRENITMIVLHENTSDSTLEFVSYGGIGEVPDVVKETDTLEVDGERYEFYFDEDPYWPADRRGLVTLYAANGMDEIEPVSLDHGIEAVRDRVKEAAEQGGFESPMKR